MKKSICVILTFLCAAIASGQNMVIVSPLIHEGSVAAASVPNDNNGSPCAKIIVELPLEEVKISGSYIVGNVKEKTGRYEFFVSVPKKEGQKITIRHGKYGSVDIALWLQNGALVGREAYRVKLKAAQDEKTITDMYGNKVNVENKKVEVIVHEDAGGQYLVLNVQPKDAVLYIDDKPVENKNGTITRMLKYGKHTYKAEHPLYETKTEELTIGNEKQTLNVSLTPTFGYANISSFPEDSADVYFDGIKVGTTPYKSRTMKEGRYTVKVVKDLYLPQEQEIEVKRNQTTSMSLEMRPAFGTLTVDCEKKVEFRFRRNDCLQR